MQKTSSTIQVLESQRTHMSNKIVLVWVHDTHAYKALPVGLQYLGSHLLREGYEVKILNLYMEAVVKEISPEDKELLKKECKDALLLGLSAMTNQAYRSLQISKFVKEIYPDITVTWGGIHASIFPEQTAENPYIDHVVVKEGEVTFSELLHEIKNGKDFSKVDGLAYNTDSGIKLNKPRALLDFSELPKPDWDLVDDFVKENINQYFWGDNLRFTEVHTGRGCPHRCTFCVDYILYGKSWRPRKIDDILDEMSMVKERYGVDLIELRDENFFVDFKRVEEFCDKKVARGNDVKWGACIRADYFERITDEFMEKLQKSNCYHLWFGLESGSQRILNLIKKDMKIETYYKTARMCKKYGIMPLYSFMIGQPTETTEEMKETVKLIRDLTKINKRTGILGPQILRPYPGCELYDLCVEHGFKPPTKLEEWEKVDKIALYYLSTDSLPWLPDKEFVEIVAQYTPKAYNNFITEINPIWKTLFNTRSKLIEKGLFAFMETKPGTVERRMIIKYLVGIDKTTHLGKKAVKKLSRILKYYVS